MRLLLTKPYPGDFCSGSSLRGQDARDQVKEMVYEVAVFFGRRSQAVIILSDISLLPAEAKRSYLSRYKSDDSPPQAESPSTDLVCQDEQKIVFISIRHKHRDRHYVLATQTIRAVYQHVRNALPVRSAHQSPKLY